MERRPCKKVELPESVGRGLESSWNPEPLGLATFDKESGVK